MARLVLLMLATTAFGLRRPNENILSEAEEVQIRNQQTSPAVESDAATIGIGTTEAGAFANASDGASVPAKKLSHSHVKHRGKGHDGRRTPQAMSSRDAGFLSDDLLDHFIIVPEHNLLFCFIEKVASKNFNELFRHIRTKYDETQASGRPWRKNNYEVHGWNKSMFEAALLNSSWHKAVFYREPIQRYVSAWLSKCGEPGASGAVDRDGPEHCVQQFGKPEQPFLEAASSLRRSRPDDTNATILNLSTAVTDDTTFDSHWRRQVDFCGGLEKSIQYYNTVQKLTTGTARKRISKLLRSVKIDPQDVPHFDELFPANGLSPKDTHVTNASREAIRLIPADKSWVANTLINHYQPDYALFGIKPPGWARRVAKGLRPANKRQGHRQTNLVKVEYAMNVNNVERDANVNNTDERTEYVSEVER